MFRKKSILFLFVFLLIVGVSAGVWAGNLEPSEPPGSTMKPLDQIEPRTALIPGPVPIGADYRVLIQEPGTYYLTADITINFRHAVKITASNVTLDMNGFRLYSSWTPPTLQNQDFDGIHIAGGCENIEIRNGSIVSDTAEGQKGFRYGVYAAETSCCIRLSNLSVIGSRREGIWLGGGGSQVNGCTVCRNGTGVYVGRKSTVEFCRIGENTTDELTNICGIVGGGCNRIVGNLVFQNGTDALGSVWGILAGEGSVVKENVVCDNGENCSGYVEGIYAGMGSLVADCTVTGNGMLVSDSIGIWAGKGVSIIGCAVYHNGYYAQSSSAGIAADEGCTLKNNVVYSNGLGCDVCLGIYAPFYCLLDGNAAYGQTENIYTNTGCVLGLNMAP
ncbi:MAG TPA: hypothetical protein PKY88_05175 [Anaerohalosphaeraceae bacterium]|nr:hypothetical protein [Anaerohalosphaeraceae bacterium]